MSDYLDFIPAITERSQIKTFMETDIGVKQQEQKLYDTFATWWQLHSPNLAALPQTKKVMELRAEFMSSFVTILEPVGLLDRFKVAGVIASWWDEVKYELRTLSESNFGGLVDSWVDTIKDALEKDDDDKKKQEKFNPLEHKLVLRLMPNYLEDIADAEALIADLEQQKAAFERGDEAEGETGDEDEAEAVNYVKQLEMVLKTLKNAIKEPKKELKSLKKSPLLHGDKIAEIEAFIAENETEIKAIELQLEPYKEINRQLREAKTQLRTLKNGLVQLLETARTNLTEVECQDLVLGIFKDGLISELDRYMTAHRQEVIAAVENWWDKYRVNLQNIESERDSAAQQLSEFMRGLGYV
ncbi:MAG: hypothetical protein EA343_18260 [Nodularia sp. (in: Bacteria)]|nr:MAG: hypothetical protein EA343_18260 [Nodularia sp. (in: cyanobacteria)]